MCTCHRTSARTCLVRRWREVFGGRPTASPVSLLKTFRQISPPHKQRVIGKWSCCSYSMDLLVLVSWCHSARRTHGVDENKSFQRDYCTITIVIIIIGQWHEAHRHERKRRPSYWFSCVVKPIWGPKIFFTSKRLNRWSRMKHVFVSSHNGTKRYSRE